MPKGNTQNMDLLRSLEIYIPVEAEVKSIPLWSLPNSVLRRMGLPLAGTKGPRNLADSPEGIWICPAVLQRKGQRAAPPTEKNATENIISEMSREIKAAPGPFRMSFVSANHAAYSVLKDLKDISPGTKVSAQMSHAHLSTPCSTLRNHKDAVVIYHGRIYLSVRKPSQSQSQPACMSSIPSTSDVSSRSQKRRTPEASFEPADKEHQRKRLRITLPEISPKQTKDQLTKPDHSTTDQELLRDNGPKKKHTTYKVMHTENKKDVTHMGRDAASSKTGRSVPQPTDSVHSVHSLCHKDASRVLAAEEAAGQDPAWFQPQEKEMEANSDSEIKDQGCEEADSTNQNRNMDSEIKIDGDEPGSMFGMVEQSCNQSWTRRESQSAACTSMSLQQKVDFNALAQEEKIAQMKAKLRQTEAVLNSLHSS